MLVLLVVQFDYEYLDNKIEVWQACGGCYKDGHTS